MRIVLRLAAWVLVSAFALSLSSCAELALPPEKLYPVAQANVSSLIGSNEGLIVNIAPTPSPAPSLLPTVTPILPPTPDPTSTPIPITDPPAVASDPVTSTPRVAAVAKLNITCREPAGQLKDGYFSSTLLGKRQHYFVYLPPCYTASNETRYPVVYLLHGIPMDERHWLDEGIVAVADKLFRSGELPPFIIVMPHGEGELYSDSSGGSKSWEGVFVNELLPAIDARYRTLADPEHRAIGGISRGGVWALEIAFTHPGLFDAVGGHSPALSVNRAGADYDPLTLAKTAPIDTLRIFLDAGDADWTRFATLDLSKVLDARNIPHTFTIGKGDHDYPYWASQVEAYLRFYGAPWKAEKIIQQQLSSITQ